VIELTFFMSVSIGQWETVLNQIQKPQVKGVLRSQVETYEGHPSLEQAIQDSRSYWYDDKNVPRIFLNDFARVYPVDYQLDVRTKAGNPNNQEPWRHNGGLHNVVHTGQRLLWTPPNQWTELKRLNKVVRVAPRELREFNAIEGTFPDNSYVVEFLYHKGRMFEIRSRHRVEGVWEEDEQYEIGDRPPGYVSVDNCKDCHSDIGKHASQLRDRGVNYRYGTISGLEVGGPIRFHAAKIRPGRAGYRYEIRDDVKHFVRWVRR
jgi:hypothetical protein